MDFAIARRRMVEQQVVRRGVTDPMVIAAMLKVPRHLFVEEALRSQAYSDFPLPIGEKQTISQPFMVGFMTEALLLKGGEKILEIGTGSGYQAAVLAQIAGQVFSVERHAALARKARLCLDAGGCRGVIVKVCDGTSGWADEAPFDGIIVTAGAPAIPEEYRQQLKTGGRLVIPVGDRSSQVLFRITRLADNEYREERLLDCRFVPLVGQHGWRGEEG
ncbi:protein-L-isoaspartate(D-aspartate) O-methyltransferase [Desulfuromonas carbonis]|uniref:protein-L-isoaspartate(D-aspartate) O-methyltransferase n=1 Tax=Desulfuromonas sp. DDH964 TaxID=1823759 RepID=UPI00078BDB89|nr:protein-L-isoaspartate(D-aspartate) O-methyltransferase [Desulfuromonas sp. DDH964]AMV72204.1 protein-L-isoaspartate O-methyltransferase [Desulfuromonas sp. DDH964]